MATGDLHIIKDHDAGLVTIGREVACVPIKYRRKVIGSITAIDGPPPLKLPPLPLNSPPADRESSQNR